MGRLKRDQVSTGTIGMCRKSFPALCAWATKSFRSASPSKPSGTSSLPQSRQTYEPSLLSTPAIGPPTRTFGTMRREPQCWQPTTSSSISLREEEALHRLERLLRVVVPLQVHPVPHPGNDERLGLVEPQVHA